MNEDALFPATVIPDDEWWHPLWNDPRSVYGTLCIKPGMPVVDLSGNPI